MVIFAIEISSANIDILNFCLNRSINFQIRSFNSFHVKNIWSKHLKICSEEEVLYPILISVFLLSIDFIFYCTNMHLGNSVEILLWNTNMSVNTLKRSQFVELLALNILIMKKLGFPFKLTDKQSKHFIRQFN